LKPEVQFHVVAIGTQSTEEGLGAFCTSPGLAISTF